MTLSIDGSDIGRMIEVASLVGSIVAMLVVSLIVYLMVRPPRHVRRRRKAARRGDLGTEMEPVEAEELWRLIDRMELRIEVLERALADQIERPAIGGRETEQTSAPVEDRVSGRTE
jgi:hypothetical protein